MKALLVALVACGGSQVGEPARGVAVEVEIASVTLDACGAAEAESVACPKGEDCSPGCDGARLQLSLRSSDGKPTKISVEKIELVDAGGIVLGWLPPREPMRWTDKGQFAAWDEVVGAGEILAATYRLDKTKWAKPDGHYDRSATYRVRVVVAIGGGTRTIEKRATVMPEPMVET